MLARPQREAPDEVARPGDHQRRRLAPDPELAAVAAAQVALEMDRLFGPVDRPVGEEVGERFGARPASGERRARPAEPGLLSVEPLPVVEPLGGALDVEDEQILALARHDPPHPLADRPRLRHLPARAPGGVGAQRRDRGPPELVRVRRRSAHRPLESDFDVGHRLRGGERGDGEDHRARLLERREREVGDLHSRPESRRVPIDPAQADEVVAGSAGARDPIEVRREVEAERRRLAGARERQRHESRDRRRAERGEPGGERAGIDVGGGVAPGLRRLARTGRTLRLVDLDRLLGERPEVAVERVDPVDAQINALVAAAFERQAPRSVALDDPLAEAWPQVRLAARKDEEELALARHLERPAGGVGEPGRHQRDAVERLRAEVAGEHQVVARDRHVELLDGGLEAHQVARLDRGDRRALASRRGRELQPGGRVSRAGERLLAAGPHATGADRQRLAAAAEAGDAEGVGGGERELEGGALRERVGGEPEAEQGAHARGDRPLGLDQELGRLAGRGAVERAHGEVLGAEHASSLTVHARERP